jgi:myo-inositol-1(or 4)-monophosphatase
MIAIDDRLSEVHRATGELHPSLGIGAAAALIALHDALRSYDRAQLERSMGVGADGTTTMFVDGLVEEAIVEALAPTGVNVLSEEIGFVDRGSAFTLVVDPLDGSANAAAGVPLACFAAALAVDGAFLEAATVWLETGTTWAGTADGRIAAGGPWATTGRTSLQGAAVSLLRPQAHTRDAWWRVAERAARIRILSTTALEAMLVLQGSTDAFADAASDTHRLVDLAAAAVLLPTVGGAVIDLHGRPIELDMDLHRRWSGIVAATPQLADEIATAILG